MSRQDLENLRGALASDPSALLALLDDEVQWDYVGAFPEAVTYRGPREVGEFLRQWAGGFEDFGFEADETIDAGDSVVVCLHQWGRGKDTGAQVESRTWQVFNFRHGKVIRCRGYATKAEALASVGLER
jgi:ketosteroid isomerase-like protein